MKVQKKLVLILIAVLFLTSFGLKQFTDYSSSSEENTDTFSSETSDSEENTNTFSTETSDNNATSQNDTLSDNSDEYQDEDEANDATASTYPSFDSYWQAVTSTYKHIQYDDISTGKYAEQYVLIDGFIDNIERDDFKYIKSKYISYDIYFKTKKGYIAKKDELAHYSDNLRFNKVKKLKNGYKIRFCFYIHSDNSFGNDFLSLNILSKKTENVKKKIKAEYKKSCKSYSYKKIARNPKKYKGKRIKFSGEILQTLQEDDEDDEVILRISTDSYANNVFYVTYHYRDGQDKFLEDDKVLVYGELSGSETYTSLFGESITIPSVEAEYINLK